MCTADPACQLRESADEGPVFLLREHSPHQARYLPKIRVNATLAETSLWFSDCAQVGMLVLRFELVAFRAPFECESTRRIRFDTCQTSEEKLLYDRKPGYFLAQTLTDLYRGPSQLTEEPPTAFLIRKQSPYQARCLTNIRGTTLETSQGQKMVS